MENLIVMYPCSNGDRIYILESSSVTGALLIRRYELVTCGGNKEQISSFAAQEKMYDDGFFAVSENERPSVASGEIVC